MLAPVTNTHDQLAIEKLSVFVSECIRESDNLGGVEYTAERRARDSWGEESSEMLRRYAAAAMTPSFERAVHAEVDRLLPSAASGEVQDVPKSIASGIVGHVIARLVAESVLAIDTAREQRAPNMLRRALDGARETGDALVREFYFFDRYGTQRISLEDFRARREILNGASYGLHEGGPRYLHGGAGYLVELSHAIDCGDLFLDIFEQLPHADWGEIAHDREIYGAKGALLRALVKGSEDLRPFLDRAGLSSVVPDFTLIPAAVYEQARHDPSVSKEVRAAYEWIEGRSVMIRSSALHSEDGEHLGAGVYASYRLPRNASFELYCEVVGKVYDSTESSLAQEYRRQIDFSGDEKMGVVIQEYQEGDHQESSGHINTCRFQMPSIIEVTCQDRYVPVFLSGHENEISNSSSVVFPLDRGRLERQIGSGGDSLYSAFLLPSDHTQDASPLFAGEVGKLGLLLEMYFQRPMQIEFVAAGYRIYLVQARPLPEAWEHAAYVQFPERSDFLWQGASFGVLDEDLEILPDDEANCERSGLVIIDSGWRASDSLAWLERVLPKKGAVWILRPSENMRGHIESRCAERGLVIITGELLPHDEAIEYRMELLSRLWDTYGSDVSDWLFRSDKDRPCILPPHEGMKRLRVVSNGLEARVYT